MSDPSVPQPPSGPVPPADPSAEPGPATARPPGLSRRRLLGALVALAVPLIPIAIGVTITGGGASPAAARPARPLFTPVRPPAAPHQANLLVPPGRGALVALLTRPTVMRSRPGGPVIAPVALRTPFGSPQAMWVQRLAGAWLGVVSVLAGNHRLGWIPARVASLSRVAWQLHVSLQSRRLTISDDGRTVQRYMVAVGAPQSPTPRGRFAVTDRLLTGDPAGPYGCCILALSAVAPHAIQGWTGGDRIAIHSTPESASIGQPVSHGCVRLTLAEGRWLIAHIPLGTPTIVSS